MVLSDLAIKRPVLATVASLLIVVVGAAALMRLPVREYPNVDKPVVTVTTAYTGAAPEIVATEVTEVIEGAISGVDGVDRIESSSREGRSRTVIEFASSRNVDAASNDVREAVSRVLSDLPEEADPPEVVKADADAQPVLRLSLTSERLSPADLTDLAERTIVERLSTVTGVGQVEVYGERRYAIRVWLDRRALAARGLAVGDVEAALRRGNVELPSGTLEAPSRQFTVRTESRLSTPDEFRDVVVGRVGDYPIRLGEVARVERGVEDDSTIVRAQGASAIGLGVLRQSEANTIAVSNGVRAQLASIRPLLPEGVDLQVTSDDATFIQASIKEVVKALLLAVGLVVLVIFLFLGSLRATLIPAVTIPVSIVGTFTLLAGFGFSINVLTLLALLLAIGLVVDDAIVVLENVQRRVDGGESPLLGAYLGTRQVTFAVLGTSLALVAVFVPISFIPGDIGRLFAEFGIALASAVALSTFVALSLTPMLCARMIRPVGGGWLTGRIERAIGRLTRWYRAVLVRALAAPIVVLAIAGAVATFAAFLFVSLPQELVPQEDRGGFFVSSSAPEGATIQATNKGAKSVDAVLQPLLKNGEATRILSIVGFRNQPNRAFTIVGLGDYDARKRSQMDIVDSLRGPLGTIPDVRAVPINRSGLGSSSGSQGVQFIVGGPDYADVEDWVERIIALARDNPGLADVDTDYAKTRPLLSVAIDRPKAENLGISAEDIAATLQTMLASRQVTSYIDRSRSYQVILQAQAEDRQSPGDLENIFVRAQSGDLVPLSALVTTRMAAAPPDLERFDRLPSIEIDASLVGDYDLGAAIAYFDQIAAEELPVEARTSFNGAAREFQRTSNGLYLTFGLALLVVFLVLAAIFESFIHPLVIMLSVPLAVSAAFASLVLVGGSLNIYSQIGIIMLVGLTAKNGILIVEFANQLRDEGRSVREAILEGSVLRLRPILMTVASTILGAVPLAIATGAGSESRSAIGVVVIGGLGVASVLTLFVTPVLYDLLARFTRPAGAVAVELDRAMEGTQQPAE